MKDREEFFFRLAVVLGFVLLVCFFALVANSCSSTASIEISKEVLC